ncbi:MAG: GAF domain-containing protein, partial [Planctomycetota bacterium]
MKDEQKTKKQLIDELKSLRRKCVRLEKAEGTAAGPTKAAEAATDLAERKQAAELLRLQRDVATALGSAHERDAAMAQLLKSCLGLAGVDCGGVYLVDPLCGGLELVVHENLSEAFVASGSTFDADAPQTALIRKGEATYRPYNELGVPIDEVRKREGFTSIAVVPVKHDGEVIAALNLASHTHPEFPIDARHAIEGIAAAAGGAIARLQAEQALRVSEERLGQFMDSASDSFYLLDANLDFVDINQKGLEIIGKNREDVVGRNITEIVPDAESSGRLAKHREVLRTGEPFMADHHVAHPVFGEKHFILKSFKVGEGLGVIASDITARVVAEESLRRRDAILQTVSFAAERFLLGGEWETDMRDVLQRLGQALGVTRAHLFRNESVDGGALAARQIFEWVARGKPRRPSGDPRVLVYESGFQEYAEILSKGQVLAGRTREFSEGVRRILEAQRTLSTVAVPVFLGIDWWGFLGFADGETEREWSDAEVGALRAAANTLGAALLRTQAEETIRFSEQRFRSMIEQTTDAVFCYEYDPPVDTSLAADEQALLLSGGVLAECNDVCARSYGAEH